MKTESYLEYVDNLEPSYREVFDQVMCYVNLLDGLSENRKNEKLEDLLEVMLSAQQDHQPVEKVCGRNIQTFCRTFCAEYDFRFGIYEVLRSCRFMIGLLIIESLLFAVGWFLEPEIRQTGSLFWLRVENGSIGFILTITLIEVLVTLIGMAERHLMFRMKKFSQTVMNMVRIPLILLCLAAIALLFRKDTIAMPLGIQMTVCLLWLGALYYLRSVLKGDVEEGLFGTTIRTLMEENPANMDEQFATAMEKKYRTMRDKKQKKGIAYPMSRFLEDEDKTSGQLLKLRSFYFFLPVILSVCLLLSLGTTGMAADAAAEMLCCVGITFAVECIVMFLLWRFIKKTALTRLAWTKEKRNYLESEDKENT